MYANMTYTTSECCLKQFGSDSNYCSLWLQGFLPIYKVFCSHRNVIVYRKPRIWVFSYCQPSVCVKLECLWIALCYSVSFKKLPFEFTEFCLGITIELPRDSEVHLNICLLSHAPHYSKWHSQHLTIINKIINQLQIALKLPCVLQYQIFSQDWILCVKTSKHVYLISMQICFLIWTNTKIICIPELC